MQYPAVRVVRVDRTYAFSHGCIIGACSTRRIREFTNRSYRDCCARALATLGILRKRGLPYLPSSDARQAPGTTVSARKTPHHQRRARSAWRSEEF